MTELPPTPAAGSPFATLRSEPEVTPGPGETPLPPADVLPDPYQNVVIPPPPRKTKRPRWAMFGIVLGALLLPLMGVAASYLAWSRIIRAREPSFAPVKMGDTPVARPAPRPVRTPHAPQKQPAAAPDPTPTKVEQQGRITVVDIGGSTPSLADALRHERAQAASAKETLVLMTTARGCDPCRGVDASLADPLLQSALAQVRLVRVDIADFHEDLQQMRIPDERIPGFYLLEVDMAPRDGVDGGEWDADIPANIAPVLGAFVKGKYKKRREPWRPLPGSGVNL